VGVSQCIEPVLLILFLVLSNYMVTFAQALQGAGREKKNQMFFILYPLQMAFSLCGTMH
jgi:hypothetical protein